MGVNKRVLEYLEIKGISKYRFAKDLRVSNRLLDANSNMGADKAAKIITYYPEINPEWLLTGRGNMLREGVEGVSNTVTGDNNISIGAGKNNRVKINVKEKAELEAKVDKKCEVIAGLKKEVEARDKRVEYLKGMVEQRDSRINEIKEYLDKREEQFATQLKVKDDQIKAKDEQFSEQLKAKDSQIERLFDLLNNQKG